MSEVIVVGSYVQDLAFNTEVFPAPGETRIGTFKTGAGGKGFNQAVACGRQGVPTLFIGAVGDDLFGQGVRDFVANEEFLEASLQVWKEHPSGAASIVVNESAENLIVVALGANEHLSQTYIESFKNRISETRILVSQVESNIDATIRAFKIAKEAEVRTVLNPAPINPAISRELMSMADILVPNETEFLFMMDHLFEEKLPQNYWTLDDETLHALCRKAGVETVVLTLGEKGCFVSESENFYRVPAVKVTARDTTGAGDGFNGGLAAGMIRFPDNFKRAIQYANTVAGLSTTKPGTAPAMPLQKDVDAFEYQYTNHSC